MTETRTYWHVAHPAWQPGSDLMSRNALATAGVDIPWTWDEAPDGTDCDVVCLFRDDEEGRQYRDWMAEDRPECWVLRVDLSDEVPVGRPEWEPMFAAVASVPAAHITVVREAK